VLLTPSGVPKVSDFGLARPVQSEAAGQTRPGDRLGTAAYMAPEQAEGRLEALGPATDVFGLGGILYDLLTGRPPHQGQTFDAVLEQARQGRVVPPREIDPQVPRALERICLRALAADPGQRYPSAAALREDLRRYLRRPLRLVLAAASLAGVLIAALVVWLLAGGLGRPTPGGPPAEAAPLMGDLIVRVWTPEGEDKRGLSVDEVGALPVRNKEMLRLEARLSQPAYVYLVWLDSEGHATPLYPWNEVARIVHKTLAAPPPERPAQSALQSPSVADKGWRVGGKSGLDTILLLARRTPLPAEVSLGELFAALPPTRYHSPQEWAVRGFDAGQPVGFLNLGTNRGPEEEAGKIDDPLLELMGRLREQFETIRAVRFAHEGN
jgi:hypothetical protein